MTLKKFFTPFRSAAYLLVLYCAAHTTGGMLAQQSMGPAADAVFAQMKAVSGMGWALTVAHAVTAILSWKYFFIGPTVFGIAITLLMGFGTCRKGVLERRSGFCPRKVEYLHERSTRAVAV
ncbi:hypothetical protein [Corallococcus exercitus]|uniref:Uncharacterized protein n=1 Tax=Corallococcus exercitus TaxID=2316736 RepID=A0A7Y4K0E1_9BACT|nr:hypothetical protein [Corallococcus exercitus]NOK14563.1 hypothetical protein [Corallococcus exercitus]